MNWKLLKPAYGFEKSGRFWHPAIEKRLTGERFVTIPGLLQLFVKRGEDEGIRIALGKFFDDILFFGSPPNLNQFHKDIDRRFSVCLFLKGHDFIFNRLTVHQSTNYSVVLDTKEYFDRIIPSDLTKERIKQIDAECTLQDTTAYLSLAGSIKFLGNGVLPQAAFAASYLLRSVGSLKVSKLFTAKNVLKELKALESVRSFKSLTSVHSTISTYLCFSDAIQGSSSYRKTGYVSGVFLPAGFSASITNLTG